MMRMGTVSEYWRRRVFLVFLDRRSTASRGGKDDEAMMMLIIGRR